MLGDSVEQIDGKLAVEALGPVTTTAHGNLTQTAKQALTLSAKEIALVAKETVTITAGANTLTITKDGDIKLNGKKLGILGDRRHRAVRAQARFELTRAWPPCAGSSR